QASKLFRLEIIAEGDTRHIEQGVTLSRRQIVSDGDVGDRRTAGGMLKCRGGANPAVGQRKMNIVAAQRIEFRRIGSVREGEAAIDGEITPAHVPLARYLTQQQRDLADDRVGARKCAAGPRAAAVAANLLGIDPY